MVRRLALLLGSLAAALVAGGAPAAAEPPSAGGTLFVQATTPCVKGSNLFEFAASENAAGVGGGAGLYTVPNTFPPGNCGFPFPAGLNLNCVEVSGQEVFMSGTFSLGSTVTGTVVLHVLAGSSPQIGIDFPQAINGGGWRCGAARVPMEAATGIVRLTPP